MAIDRQRPAPPDEGDAPGPPGPGEASRAGRKILIIDDSMLFRALFVEWLRDGGYETLQADDGDSGIEVARAEDPDLVLCDLRMPRVDGLEVLSTLREEKPDTPIIIVSGSGEMKDAISALKLGAWDYLLKPLDDMAVLDVAVQRSLERANLLEENRRYRAHLEQANAELAESLRRLQEDEAAGRRVQFALMPPRDEVFGDFRFSRRILPSSYLSGDFVDYFSLDPDHLAFFIADVSGHGVSSAFVTVLLHDFVNQAVDAYREGRDDLILRPAALLSRLNEHILCRKLNKSLTIFLAVVDRTADRMTFCNAGQFPYPVFHDGEEAHLLENRGFGVGHFPFAEYEAVEMPLPSEFTMTFVSDGILEVLEHESLQAKENALLERAGANSGADATIEALMADLGLGRERDLPDDITFLMVRRRGA